MKNDQLNVSCLKFNGHKIELTENTKGLPVARLYKLLTAGINKNTFKLIEGYFFQNEKRREDWVTKKVSDLKTRIMEQQKNQEAKAAVRANMQHGFEVGQIYYDSWGYDQTNIDFYEITEVKGKSVIIRAIACKYVDGTAGHDSCNVKPVPGNYCGEPQLKHIIFYMNNDNKPVYHIKSRHGWISLYTKEDKGVYSSWGR